MSTDHPTALSCEACGVCCMHMAVPPYDEEERLLLRHNYPDIYADLVGVIQTRHLQLQVTEVDNIPCGFLDTVTRQCRHHDHVPTVCGLFEIGETYCRNFRNDTDLPRFP